MLTVALGCLLLHITSQRVLASVPGTSATGLTVCVDYDGHATVVLQALRVARQMFAGVGAPIVWRLSPPACPSAAIQVKMVDTAPHTLSSGILGTAELGQAAHIHLFTDRIHDYTSCSIAISYCATVEGRVLAHVLAHEIGHVFEGSGQHSAYGVMKAKWDAGDYLQMTRGELPFAPPDVQSIRAGLIRRHGERDGPDGPSVLRIETGTGAVQDGHRAPGKPRNEEYLGCVSQAKKEKEINNNETILR